MSFTICKESVRRTKGIKGLYGHALGIAEVSLVEAMLNETVHRSKNAKGITSAETVRMRRNDKSKSQKKRRVWWLIAMDGGCSRV